jgi:5-methyltetrahydropteroyltriglutamate--homocysteine methyltransferase
MASSSPPFRADHVGSLLRPASVRDARAAHAEGRLADAALREIEDEAIAGVIARQEAIGLNSVTDGELRRGGWALDFLKSLDGVETRWRDAVHFQGVEQHRAEVVTVTDHLDFSGSPLIDHFKFLKARTGRMAKMTIPAPDMLLSPSRDWRESVVEGTYGSLDLLFDDLAAAYGKAIKAFGEAGCRYLQLDDCAMAFVCDAKVRAKMIERGDDPDTMLERWVELLNAALGAKPEGMVISTHVCRGNFRSTWMAEGGYEPVAEALFGRVAFDAYFLEYDSERAGGFEPLRYVPKGGHKKVILGLLTTKVGELESDDEIKRRIDQAAAFVDLDRLGLSPQCGFSSSEHGNNLSEDEQWAKLSKVVEIADAVWGGR